MTVVIALFFTFLHSASVQAALVYSVLTEESWRIYFQRDLAASAPPAAGHPAGDGSAPAFSAEKQQIAFEVYGKEIHVCSLRSSSRCQVVRPKQGSAARPVWHPVTGDLLFVRYVADERGEDSDIFTTRQGLTETGALLTQTGIQDYPDVSPDGRLLAYTSSQKISLHRGAVQVIQQLWIMNLETGEAQQLLLSNAQDIHPDWSPSGEKIAFSSNRSGEFEIWVVNHNGSGLHQVTDGPGAKTWPAWSPDGESIMFTLVKDGRQSLWLIDANGAHLRPFEPFGPGADIQLKDADWR